MSIVTWVREKLGKHRSPKMSEALRATEEVAEATRELRYSIEPFKLAEDPFIALWAYSYEVLQENRMHEGPP
jgi:hypothetical protein